MRTEVVTLRHSPKRFVQRSRHFQGVLQVRPKRLYLQPRVRGSTGSMTINAWPDIRTGTGEVMENWNIFWAT